MSALRTERRRGMPLAMLCLLLSLWVAGRAALWESPFPLDAIELSLPEIFVAEGGPAADLRIGVDAEEVGDPSRARPSSPLWLAEGGGSGSFLDRSLTTSLPRRSERPMGSVMAGGHQLLMAAAFRVDWSTGTARVEAPFALVPSSRETQPPFAAPYPTPARRAMDRWSLDAFAYYRAGSDAESVTQGRAPLYGASQTSAILQYRIAPASGQDPRLYVRGYRALVADGESELAAGASVRPVGAIPVRVAAEMRVTEGPLGRTTRPAAYAVTEFPPLKLPLDIRAEAYASGGYVGGRASTPFVDGQASITSEVIRLEGSGSTPVRLSIGAGAWGGAQREAHRIDVGPTMRVDLDVGPVPARLSVDWREQVSGDAAPGSGVAATLSTRF